MRRKGPTSFSLTIVWVATVLCWIALVGCSKPVPVAFENLCQKSNDSLYISVEGYLSAGTSVLCSSQDGKRTCGLELTNSPGGTNKISVYVDEGTGKSQMEPVTKSYNKDNLIVRDNKGKIISAKDRIRVIGIAKSENDSINDSYAVCFIYVEAIERP